MNISCPSHIFTLKQNESDVKGMLPFYDELQDHRIIEF